MTWLLAIATYPTYQPLLTYPTMKKYLKRLQAAGLFALLVPALLLTGCNDDDNNTQPQQSIAQVVNTNADFTLLRAAVTKAGLMPQH